MTSDQVPGNQQPEQDTAPPAIGNQQQFREELTRLRTRLGVSLAQLEQASQQQGKRLPPATVSNVLSRDRLPEWEFTADFLAACGLEEKERQPWQQTWQDLAPALPTARAAGTPGAPVTDAPPPPPVDAPPKKPPATGPGAGAGTAGSGTPQEQQTPPKPKKEPDGRLRARCARLAKRRRAAAAVCAALVLAVTAGGYAVEVHTQNVRQQEQHKREEQRTKEIRKKHCGTLNPALVTEADGECTGVADGLEEHSDVFGLAMEPVLTAIGIENARAVQGGRYVTIAFLAPLTSAGKAADLTLDQFVGEAEGAYTAVEQANTGDSPLKIRLVLANMGSGEQHWKHAVEGLKKVKNLVAVAGMGLSQQESVDAARALSRQNLPMVADLITADGFDTTGTIDSHGHTPQPINGLTRVTLTNAVQLKALGAELKDDTRTAAVVRTSVTPNGTADYYTDSLYHDFLTTDGLKQHLDPATDFSFDPRGGPSSILGSIGQNICTAGHPIDTVYFAAREKYLPDFLEALSQRSCHSQHITVAAGSDTAALDPNTLTGLQQQGEAPITVLYASLPTASALRSRTNSDHGLYEQYLTAFTRDHHGQRFPAQHASRGYWPVLAHDAVLTATTAIRKATTPDTPRPNKYAVSNNLYALTDGAVPAATGRYGINPRTGNRTTTPTTIHHLGTTP